MPFQNGKLKSPWYKRFFRFGYDATTTNNRRRAPKYDVKSEDDHLDAVKRRKLVSTTRDIRRNYSLAAWAIRKHLDYVASFNFQSMNGNKELDERIENFVRWWSLPRNFDVSGRYGRQDFIRLAESCRVVDGDFFVYLLNSGMVQGIEGDRIANPSNGNVLPKGYDIEDFKHGIKTSKGGRAQAYIVNNRSDTGQRLIYSKVVPARYIYHFGYFDRIDQLRGVSPLASALNCFQDTYEGITYALARAKVSQFFAFALTQGSADSAGAISGGEDSNNDEDKSTYEIDFGKGPIFLQLDEGDDAKFLESQQPSQEFQGFMKIVMPLTLKALDIPFSFYDEAYTNYSGQRTGLLLYEQSARTKQRQVISLLDFLTHWRLTLAILDGVIKLPMGMTISDLRWEWFPIGLPWIDPWDEIKADQRAIEIGLNSRQRILKRQGLDWADINEELRREEEELRRAGRTPPSDVPKS